MTKKVQDLFTFDPAMQPGISKDVVILRGTWYEMGIQYGQQAKDAIQLIISSKRGFAVKGFGSFEKAWRFVKENYYEIYEKNIPELVEFWKGVAEATELSFEDIVVGSSVFNSEAYGCSTMSVWGDMTYDGRVLAGSNMDEPTYAANYDSVVVCYPEEGNAVISNRGFLQNCNLIMNDKGVVFMNSAGQDGGEGDRGYGVPNAKSGLMAAIYANNAEEARDRYLSFGSGNGENGHTVDVNKHAYIVEHNARTNVVRVPGEFGEQDFMLNCNGFFTKEMEKSIFQGEDAFTDALPRYWTEEKILKNNMGNVTMDVIDTALGCTDTYVDEHYMDIVKSGRIPAYMKCEHGSWIRNIWDETGVINEWTPENRAAAWKCLIRTICDPQTKEYFITGSCTDNLLSVQPGATGNYMRLTLKDTPEEVNDDARAYAQLMIWLAERDIDKSGSRNDMKRLEYLDKAKAAFLEGYNYQFLSNNAEEENDLLQLLSKSTTAFCRAQSLAQMAHDDPHKIERDGKDMFIPGAFIGG